MIERMTLKDLSVGTRIFNNGDMANPEAFGVIVRAYTDRWGEHVDVVYDDGRESRMLSPCQFSREYLGHGGTRFVTEEEYQRWRTAREEAFRKWSADFLAKREGARE